MMNTMMNAVTKRNLLVSFGGAVITASIAFGLVFPAIQPVTAVCVCIGAAIGISGYYGNEQEA